VSKKSWQTCKCGKSKRVEVKEWNCEEEKEEKKGMNGKRK
jgi:hypothetical protein